MTLFAVGLKLILLHSQFFNPLVVCVCVCVVELFLLFIFAVYAVDHVAACNQTDDDDDDYCYNSTVTHMMFCSSHVYYVILGITERRRHVLDR